MGRALSLKPVPVQPRDPVSKRSTNPYCRAVVVALLKRAELTKLECLPSPPSSFLPFISLCSQAAPGLLGSCLGLPGTGRWPHTLLCSKNSLG